MLLMILIFLLIPLALTLLPGRMSGIRPWIYIIGLASGFTWLLFSISTVNEYGFIDQSYSWIPQLNLDLEFRLDALSLVFGLLITGVGIFVFMFAKPYMSGYEAKGRFFAYLSLFSGAMLGLVFSSNLLLMFIFWELTTVFSFFLISFFNEKEASRKSAFQALILTGFGGLSLLAGILLLGNVAGGYSIGLWIEHSDVIRESRAYLPGLILILLGVFTKSAQFPFHFWLPGAMQAPGPVSAFLHSATMVKAGFYLLARLNPVLGNTPEWIYIISTVGVVTMLVGAYFAVTMKDLKAILAFTTINALGVLVLLMGIDTNLSIKAALLFLFVHAFYKAALFMVAGIIEKKTGTRDIDQLSGLRRVMPVTFVITILLVLSMAGLPPMLGFLGKELIYEAKLQLPGIAAMVLVFGVISNIFMVTISALLLYRIFLGKTVNAPKIPNEKGVLLLAGPVALAALSLFFGLFPGVLGRSLIESALRVVSEQDLQVKLKLWHGFNDVFFLSLFTIVAGFLLFTLLAVRKHLTDAWSRLNRKLFNISPSDVFQSIIDGMVRLAEKNTAIMQHGYHRFYILTIFIFAAAAIWFQVIYTWGWSPRAGISAEPFYMTAVVVLVTAATIYSTLSRTRVATIIALGVVGYGIALIYLYFSAIDLAITQVLVETLIMVMFILILQRLPRFARLSSRMTKIRDLLVALSFGSVMTVVAIKAVHLDFNHPISDYFLENSYTGGFGKNVVNVILVDFRALDTLGEVVVLTVAAVGVSLLVSFKKQKS